MNNPDRMNISLLDNDGNLLFQVHPKETEIKMRINVSRRWIWKDLMMTIRDDTQPTSTSTLAAEVTHFDKFVITGFAYCEMDKGRVIEVVLIYAGKAVAKTIANRFDPSQFNDGIADGLHAFSLAVPPSLRIAVDAPIGIVTSDGKAIAGAPGFLFDLFRLEIEERFAVNTQQLSIAVYHGGFINI